MIKNKFIVGGRYSNNIGEYEVMEINEHTWKMKIKYNDGTISTVSIEIQQNIQDRKQFKFENQQTNTTTNKGKKLLSPQFFDNPETYIKKGKICLADGAKFKFEANVCNLFGYKLNPKQLSQKGAKDHPIYKNILIWFPKINDFGKWENILSTDGNEIKEKGIDPKDNLENVKKALNNERTVRIVFAAVKGGQNMLSYQFKGVFKLDRERTEKEQCNIWKKISDEVETHQTIDGI
jgi:hypothetical protein